MATKYNKTEESMIHKGHTFIKECISALWCSVLLEESFE
ncbi:hypothetical protein M2306_001270 [Myroides gitamensis]|nr:hypothetical protein [Myroides odoratus]MDH6600576.1 hypothetical protein [Myroides gitamensis]